MIRLGAALLAALALAAPAAGAGVDPNTFRYQRTLTAPAGGPIEFDADGPLYAHAGDDFVNLRVLDAKGEQVAWRMLPESPQAGPQPVRLLNAGREGAAAVALLDLGPSRAIHDTVVLDIPGRNFTGVVTVSGSDDRSTFTRLGSSRVFDLAGAKGRARSTVVTFSPSDFRYLQLRATGVSRIAGATVSGRAQRPDFRPLAAHATVRAKGKTTEVTLDLGYANMPVDELRITAVTPRYDRTITIETGPAGARTPVTGGRIYRYFGTPSPPVDVGARARYVTVVVSNGDDPPLRGLNVEALARPRTILVDGGHPGPLRLVYGGRPHGAPDYEFARLPRGALALDRVRRGTLGPETRNAGFEPAPDTRSWVKRHPVVVDAALAVAAAAILAAGVLTLRKRA